MKREALTLAATIVFALSLAGTSKAPAPTGSAGASAASIATIESPAPPSLGPKAALPDTASWKPYASGKVTAKVPPGANLTCTAQNNILVCVLMRGQKLLGSWGAGGSSFSQMVSDIKARKTDLKVLHDEPDALVVHRDDPKFGGFCEYVAQARSGGLRAVFALTDGQDPKVFKMIALQDSDCFDAVAFSRTLQVLP
jgi:hypothetical protein